MARILADRPPSLRPRYRVAAIGLLAFVLVAAGWAAGDGAARAQDLSFPERGPSSKSRTFQQRKLSGREQMLVQAREINYDYVNNRVSAVGNVQIYYAGSTLEADKVTYDQNTKRLHAQGNVRLTEPNGRVTHGHAMNLSDDYRDGFVDSLRLEQPDQSRMAAARADRSAGNYTVFHKGVYTACLPCKDDPKRPPLWQVKAARIVHDQGERMIYFEDAKFEFFGRSIAYFPFFSAPDPTVKRKSGFLVPTFGSASQYGLAFEIPYYWALAPDYDVTIAPRITTKQGPLMQAEFRKRMINGSYTIRAAGIYQLDKDEFVQGGTRLPGYRDSRGSVESSGQFALNERWVWGWNAVLVSDKTFFSDYSPKLSSYGSNFDPFRTGASSGTSQIYLAGKGNRSYFDARSIHYYGFSISDVQDEIPVVHPVVDYTYTFDRPVFGGELGYNINFTSLTRESADFDAITATSLASKTCTQTADPAVKTPTNCLLRGVPGTYSRFSAETNWRRTITGAYGQIFTPFASVRADAAAYSIRKETGVSNFIETGDNTLFRAMPTVGLEYRYPFINVQSWGTQTIGPVAQIIARPDEEKIGAWPNEDAQSLIFDDSNLFRVSKFSGWDRVEGGGRANVAIEYTAQFNHGGFVNALFGQSFHLFGKNSYASGGIANSGLESGLDTDRSDYVARFSYQPNRTLMFTSRFRFDKDTVAAKRTELETRVNFDRWSASVLYGEYAAQPLIGFLDDRRGILGTGTLKLDNNWVLLGSARYDIKAEKFDQTRIGIGYVDDCLILALNYITNYSRNGYTEDDHRIMLQLSLRTLGSTSLSQSAGGL